MIWHCLGVFALSRTRRRRIQCYKFTLIYYTPSEKIIFFPLRDPIDRERHSLALYLLQFLQLPTALTSIRNHPVIRRFIVVYFTSSAISSLLQCLFISPIRLLSLSLDGTRHMVHHYHDDFYVSRSFDPRLIVQLMSEGFLPIATKGYLLPKLHVERCVLRLSPRSKVNCKY